MPSIRLRSMVLILLVSLVATGSASAQRVPAVLDSVFATWNTTDGPGCTVGVGLQGARTVRAYGMANLEYGVALTPGSVMESGSVAKQFTAATVVLLAQRGKLSLDDDIRKYLPEVPNFGTPITIRQLLHHTSGIRDQWALLAIQGHPPGEEAHTLNRILDLVAHQRELNFKPGEEHLYSNTGWVLLALIVQRASGTSLAEYSVKELFLPLGMTHTEWRDDYRRVVPGRSTAYSRGTGGRWVQDMPFTMVHGNGGLLTTMSDMLTWNDALTKGTIPGGPELVRALETPGVLNDGSKIDYALGLGLNQYRGIPEISHSGATAGYRTFLGRWPSRDLSIAVFCNAGPANAPLLAHQVAQRVLDLPKDAAPPAPAVTVAVAELQPLVGAYRDTTTDDQLTIGLSGDALTVSPGRGSGVKLTPIGNNRFWSEQSGELTFERAPTGWRVTRFNNAWRRYLTAPAFDAKTVPFPDYVGTYRSDEIEIAIEIQLKEGGLSLLTRPADTTAIKPIYRDGFDADGMSLRFVRDPKGRVTGFRVFAGRARNVRFDRVGGVAAGGR